MKQKILAVIVACLTAVLAVTPAHAATSTQSVAFPMYEYPTIGNLWSDVYAAGGQVPWIIANPASGPGVSVDPTYTTYLNNKPISQRALGYVYMDYANRNIAEVLDDISEWYVMYPQISGIFVDLLKNGGAAADVCYGATVYNYVKSSHPNDLVVMNPGTNIEAAYEPYGDIFANAENTYATYTSWTPYNDGFENNAAYANRFWHIVHTTSSGNLNNALSLTRANNAGWVLITDEDMPNPYMAVPSYWSSFLSGVSSLPQTQIPNRGLTSLPAGCLDLSLATSRATSTQTKQKTTTVTNTVTNLDASRFSPGATTLTYSVPAGATLSGLSGSGWSCSVASKTCTNGSNIAANGTLPAVTATVTTSCDYSSGSVGITIKNFAANSATASAALDKPTDCAANGSGSSKKKSNSSEPTTVDEKTVTTAAPDEDSLGSIGGNVSESGSEETPGDDSSKTSLVAPIALGSFFVLLLAGLATWFFIYHKRAPKNPTDFTDL